MVINLVYPTIHHFIAVDEYIFYQLKAFIHNLILNKLCC